MPSPVTECATITLKPGIDLGTSGTDSAQAWNETLATVAKQAGYQRSYWGRQLENPNIVVWLIDWESLAAHQTFMASPSYQPFAARLLPLTENVHLHHFTPSVFPPGIIASAPVIEFATFYDTKPVFVGNVRKFEGVLDQAKAKGDVDVDEYLGGVWGEDVRSRRSEEKEGLSADLLPPVIEDIAKNGASEGKGRAIRLCLGWTSKEAHMKFRETQLFKDNIALLREGVGSAEVHHVAFKTV
ncbi:hypothetical protein LHYA1_G001638 [Lachnellula hyalina]|uniref:ABM domain-containing protein n=1 Tax=Lachnellula hyalina TaxID=1316788 RepID=A0A8H8R8X4_9HELO|nr:uncharacterized protein LHYA1_G001638 [Lachnellula hyalina]TVY28969.1 hypothetical protein LHYA1_G001638 [Lachnellula hyalina]